MTHINAVPWDADIRATDEFAAAPADGSGDADCAAALNEKVIQGPAASFSWRAVKDALLRSGSWVAIVVAAETRPVNPLVGFCITATALTDDRMFLPGADADKLFAAVDALVTAKIVTAEDAAAIKALGVGAVTPWWQSVGSQSAFNEHDISRARDGGEG